MFIKLLNSALLVVGCYTCTDLLHAQPPNSLTPNSSHVRIPVQLSVFEAGAANAFLPGNLGGPNVLATPKMVALLTKTIHEYLPPTYVDERDWNKRRELWDGVHVKLEDGKLETHRKKKMMRSGTWTRYTLSLVDPQKNLHIQFHRLEPIQDGKIAFEVTVDAVLDSYGQVNEWVRNNKLMSASLRATANVRLRLAGTVQFVISMTKLLPDVTVKPHIDYAHLDVDRYRLRRFSHVGGDAAKLFGDSMKAVVDELIEDENKKLAARLNRKLARRQKKMTFSAQDWLEKKLPLSKSKG